MPWLLFVVLAWILSFSVHYKHTWAAWILTLAGGEERKLAYTSLKRLKTKVFTRFGAACGPLVHRAEAATWPERPVSSMLGWPQGSKGHHMRI